MPAPLDGVADQSSLLCNFWTIGLIILKFKHLARLAMIAQGNIEDANDQISGIRVFFW
jgi:hypothetical protein